MHYSTSIYSIIYNTSLNTTLFFLSIYFSIPLLRLDHTYLYIIQYLSIYYTIPLFIPDYTYLSIYYTIPCYTLSTRAYLSLPPGKRSTLLQRRTREVILQTTFTAETENPTLV